MHPRKESWSDMEWQLRNWLYFTWLSGDHNTEQHVHSLDKAAWVMHDESPVESVGPGRAGRCACSPNTATSSTIMPWSMSTLAAVKLFSFCRQQAGCSVDVSDYVLGTKGTADLMKHTIKSGDTNWRYRGEAPQHVPARARRIVREHPLGQSDQQWRVHEP